MTNVLNCDNASLSTSQLGAEPQFNARETAMIRQYERLRAEWDQKLDLLECPECSNRTRHLIAAESLDRQLAVMEWKLPDAYTCPDDIAPPSGPTSIAAAFAQLLQCHRHSQEVRLPTPDPTSRMQETT